MSNTDVDRLQPWKIPAADRRQSISFCLTGVARYE
ncbi:MAG: hypothetical protein UZ16_OP3001002476 [Candidatus Hinthialibacteria bacterium OLB16]|nr:MAG: hypothetical protein UZ16_OP3001002476 [Candidatus Hinthialibacteria bacterium OLB16]